MTKRLLFIVIMFSFCGAFAQETPEVHKINGKKYYLHVVEPGNTLYGISKLYHVSVEDIELENSESLKAGLKVNQTLLIPVTAENRKELAPVDIGQNFLLHKVQPGETLYAISKHYDTTLEKLLEANPDVRDQGLKADSEIKIPLSIVSAQKDAVVAAIPDNANTHIVQQGETVYSISKQYKVTPEELVKLNQGFPIGLQIGMTIKVPNSNEGLKHKDSNQLDAAEIAKIEKALEPIKTTGLVRISLLLPLNPVFPDSVNVLNNFKISEQSRVALSYFRGFKFALDSLSKRENLKIELSLVDMARDTINLQMALKSEAFNNSDAVVGPFYTEQFDKAANYCTTKDIPIFCPVEKPSKILFKHPTAVKTIPSETMQLSTLAEFLALNYKDSNVVLINGNKFQNQEHIDFFKSRYAKALHIPDTFAEDALREIKLWDVNRETLKLRFPEPGTYVCVVPCNNAVFITKFLTGLYDFYLSNKGTYKFRVIGLESWQKRESDMDINQLHGLNVTLPTSAYLDYGNPVVLKFLKDYMKAFGVEPDSYAVQAFDLADYIVSQCKNGGKKALLKPEKSSHNGIAESYVFTRVIESSGVENKFIKLYEYNNYRLKHVASWPQIDSK